MKRQAKTPKRKNPDSLEADDSHTFQGRGYHGNQADMDVYREDEGYFGSASPFYGDLPEEKVDTAEIDSEFQARYSKLLKTALEVLTPNQYRIFEMYFVKCLSQQKIAEILGVKQQTVSESCTRILEVLRLHEGEVI